MNIRKKIRTFLFPDILRALKVTARYALGVGAMRKLPGFTPFVFKSPSVDPEKCVGCKLCVRVCPAKAINVQTFSTEKMKPDVLFDLAKEKCAACGLCVEACPEGALSCKEEKNVRR